MSSKNSKSWVYSTFILLIIIVVLGLYFYKFNNGLSSNASDWSAFGSYIGGALGSALTLITLIIVIQTYVLQSKELTLTREVHAGTQNILSNQRFENTFFNILSEKNALLNSSVGRETLRQNIFSRGITFTGLLLSGGILNLDLAQSIQTIRNHFITNYYNDFKSVLKYNDSLFRLIENSNLDERDKHFFYQMVLGSMVSGEIEFYLCYSLTDLKPASIFIFILNGNLLEERLSHNQWGDIIDLIRSYLEENGLITN